MSKVVYKIVRHGEGWAYQVDGTFSGTFPDHDAARAAARVAAGEQRVSGNDAGISYEDASGTWHDELAHGDDRPDPVVEG
ncbi:MAG: hypothetical protein WCB71_16330 [Aestuariivirga sp.]